MNKLIIQPSYYNGIKKNCIGIQKRINIISSDTETKPYKLIGTGNLNEIKINTLTHKNFIKHIDYFSKKDFTNICFFHNLKFDMQVIFIKFKNKFENSTNFEIHFDDQYNYIKNKTKISRKDYYIKVKLFFSKVWFMKIIFSKNRICQVIDSYSFLKGSLDKLSKQLNLPVKKYKVDFNNVSKSNLIQYLKNDIITEYYLGERIIDFHREYNIRITVSIAQLSARIFRHKFIKKADIIPKIPHEFIKYIVKSYHGGKNTYIHNKVTSHKNMYYYDINSLYPFAMKSIPNFLNCKYKSINNFDSSKEGVYKVSGILKKSIYAIFYTHGFDKIDINFKGNEEVIDKKSYFEIKNLWVTSYELKKALKYNLFKLNKAIGIVIEENPKSKYNPLKDFVDHFYKLKNNTKRNHPFYLFYKTVLNSLYGKFIQNMDYSQPDNIDYKEINGEFIKIPKKFIAGGLFNPLIATLITGFSRSHIFDYEVKYKSIHTATDSIMIKKPIKSSDKIGEMKLEDRGDVIIFRGKCYIFFGKKEIKFARHGFYGSASDLIKLFLNKSNQYEAERFINIKEALKCKDRKPAEFQNLSYFFGIKYDNQRITKGI